MSLRPKILTNCFVSKMYAELNLSMTHAISAMQEDRGQLWEAVAGCHCKFQTVHRSKRQGPNDSVHGGAQGTGALQDLDLEEAHMI